MSRVRKAAAKDASLPCGDTLDLELDGELAEPPRGQSKASKKVCTQCGHEIGRAATCPLCGFVEHEAVRESSLAQYGADEKHLDPPTWLPDSDPDDPMNS